MKRQRNHLTPSKRIEDSGNLLRINALEKQSDLGAYYYVIERIINREKHRSIRIEIADGFRIFPNMVAPLSANICFLKDCGIKVNVLNHHKSLDDTSFRHPLRPRHLESAARIENVVWEFRTPDDVEAIIKPTIENLYKRVHAESGALLALDYCLSELMDNVIRHSKTDCGFICFATQEKGKRIAVCIVDQGIGIKRSFEGTKYKTSTAADAITLAIRKGVTSSTEGAGNGLWTTTEIITSNSGQITLSSSGAAIYYDRRNRKVETKAPINVPNRKFPGTYLDFQIDFRNAVDFEKLWPGLRAPVDLKLESLENSANEVVISISELGGTSTRTAGRQARTYAQNIINSTANTVVLDFSGITIVSSSYADEFVRKLLTINGLERVKVYNTSPTIDVILGNVLHAS